MLVYGVTPYTYTCSLNGGASSPCTFPAVFSNLSPGPYQLSNQTTDANHIAGSPMLFDWTVIIQPPSLTPIQATQQLIQLTNSMNLAPATDQALDAQLNSAIVYFQHNLKIGACGHLNGIHIFGIKT